MHIHGKRAAMGTACSNSEKVGSAHNLVMANERVTSSAGGVGSDAGEGTCARTQGGAWDGSSVAQVDVPGLNVTGAPLRSGGCTCPGTQSVMLTCISSAAMQERSSHTAKIYTQTQLVLYKPMRYPLTQHNKGATRTRPHAALRLRKTSTHSTQPCLQARVRPAGRLGRLSLKSIQQRGHATKGPCSTGGVSHSRDSRACRRGSGPPAALGASAPPFLRLALAAACASASLRSACAFFPPPPSSSAWPPQKLPQQ